MGTMDMAPVIPMPTSAQAKIAAGITMADTKNPNVQPLKSKQKLPLGYTVLQEKKELKKF